MPTMTNLPGKIYSDSEDIFLSDVLEKYKFWKNKISAAKAEGQHAEKETEYAEAYRILLNRFSSLEDKPIHK